MKKSVPLFALLLAALLLPACAPGSPTLTVNSNNDLDDGSCDAAHCSLREAINAANAAAAAPTIKFNIPGAGVHTLTPGSPLPGLLKPMTLDATSQPGFAGTPLIELDGTSAGGGADGLVVRGGQTTIKGLVINRFDNAGISLRTAGGDVIKGNYIGTDAAGSAALGNTIGVQVLSPNNHIGGQTADARNVISGNSGPGVALGPTGPAGGNVVEGNYIGVNVSATGAVSNEMGVYVNAPGNTIGGGVPSRNIISGNASDGVFILVDNTLVTGNSIGTDWDNKPGFQNGSSGVRIKTGSHTTVKFNFIGYNGAYGVSVEEGTQNIITANSIHDNGNLGIAIDQGVQIPNDGGDADTGANQRQNYPFIASAVTTATDTTLTATLNSTPGTAFTVEFYTNASCDPSGFGEGHRLVKTVSAVSDGAGNAMFVAYFPATTFDLGNYITSTATDPAGNTSDFSNCVQVTAGATPTPVPSSTPTPTPTAAGPNFFTDINLTATTFYFGVPPCDPLDVLVKLRALHPDGIKVVVFFFRVMDRKGGNTSPWSDGQSMNLGGDGFYFLKLNGEHVADFARYGGDEAAVPYQFVIQTLKGELVRSEIFGDLTLLRCGRGGPPPAQITPTVGRQTAVPLQPLK